MSQEDKSKVYDIRVSLDKGMNATRKSMYFLLDYVETLSKDNQSLKHEIINQKKIIKLLSDRLEKLKQNAIAALSEL